MKSVLAGCCALIALSAHHSQEWSGDWGIAYDGGGPTQVSRGGVRLKPQGSEKSEETHAALVLSKLRDIKYFDLHMTFKNVATLRRGNSNPWESFWLFFNYQPDGAFKRTNYIAFKPNGVEVGVATGDRKQKILKTWGNPQCTFGVDQDLRLKRMGTRLTIELNGGEPLIYDFADSAEKPLAQHGAIGLYSEDAEVEIGSISINSI